MPAKKKRRPRRHYPVHVRMRDRARWMLEDPRLLRRAQERLTANIRQNFRETMLNGGPPLSLEELLREATRTQAVLLERGSRLEIFLTVGPVDPKARAAVRVRRRT